MSASVLICPATEPEETCHGFPEQRFPLLSVVTLVFFILIISCGANTPFGRH